MIAQIQPVVIAVLVVIEVAVWQVRVALATRGRKRSAAMLGAVNAVLNVAAIGQVVTNLDRPANIAGYAIGVAAGVYLGVVADARFAGDPVEYRVVLPGDGAAPAHELTALGWPVITQPAARLGNSAAVLTLVVGANRTGHLERDLDRITPDALRTSSRLRSVSRFAGRPPEAGTAAGTTATTLGQPDSSATTADRPLVA